jgi:hypothetical protein
MPAPSLIAVPGPSTAPAHCGCLDDDCGAGNGAFSWLRGKVSLGPLVLPQAVGEENGEGGQ